MVDEEEKFGRYTLIEKIAQGGMAQVFKAKTVDPSGIERLVVIKRILPHISADPEYVEMLVDEAKIAVNFNHGNIAQIYDLGRVADDYFIVMEYVDGKTLSQINKRLKALGRPIPLDILLYCAIETCRALSYIHNRKGPDGSSLGVVHRDISPQNIILSYGGQIKIIDFGVAKASNKEGKTESGVLKGKFAYMSPEQARSDRIDWRSDLFSLGILLWELATGERLFKRKTNHETVQAIQKAKFNPASSVRGGVPKDFDKIIKRCLQKNARHRYQDAADIAVDLEKLLLKLNPDFKRVYAAEFLYKIFGPESDEVELPNHLFTKEKTPVTKLAKRGRPGLKGAAEEDPTIVEDMESELTPIVRLGPKLWFQSQYFWLVSFIIFLFVCGTTYVYLVNRVKMATLEFVGYQDDMKLSADGKVIEPEEGKIVLESEKDHQIQIQRNGFNHYEFVVNLKPSERKVHQIKMKKKEAVDAPLKIVTIPPGAAIYVDNLEWPEKTPTTIPKLKIHKTYRIGLFLEKHKFFDTQYKVTKAKDQSLSHTFVTNYAVLHVVSDPEGAQVFLNDKPVGMTPYKNHEIAPDEVVSIRVEKVGFETDAFKLQLSAGEDKTFNLVLNPTTEDP